MRRWARKGDREDGVQRGAVRMVLAVREGGCKDYNFRSYTGERSAATRCNPGPPLRAWQPVEKEEEEDGLFSTGLGNVRWIIGMIRGRGEDGWGRVRSSEHRYTSDTPSAETEPYACVRLGGDLRGCRKGTL